MSLWFRLSLLIICCFMLVGCQTNNSAASFPAQVTKVISGQTIEVILSDGDRSQQRVRMIGINAPDWQQFPWGEQAQLRLKKLIAVSHSHTQNLVNLETKSIIPDRFDRILAHVWHNETLISEQLVKEGYVLADTKYPHKYSQRLIHAQEYARLMGNGIWSREQPLRLTPKQFRSQKLAQ